MREYQIPFYLLAGAVLTQPLSAELVQGRIMAASGEATVMMPNGTLVSARADLKIPVGSIIQTGTNSWLTVHWMEGADSVLTHDSKVSVLALDYSTNPGQKRRKVAVREYHGSLYNKMTPNSDPSEFRVTTLLSDYISHGSMTDKVTVSEKMPNEISPGFRDEIAVIKGEVQVVMKNGSSFSLLAGFQTSLSLSGFPRAHEPAADDPVWDGITCSKQNIASSTDSNINQILNLVASTEDQFDESRISTPLNFTEGLSPRLPDGSFSGGLSFMPGTGNTSTAPLSLKPPSVSIITAIESPGN